MAYLERIHVEYSSLSSLLTHSFDLSHSRSHSLRSLPLRFSFAFLPSFPMDSRINDDYAQLTVNRYFPHGKQLNTAREKWISEWKVKKAPPNGMKRTMLVESKWAEHAIECDMFCSFYWLSPFSRRLFPLIQQPKEYFHNNYCMANNRWGILLSALNRVAYRLHHFIHSFQFFSSFSCFFLFFRFTCLSCHSTGWL